MLVRRSISPRFPTWTRHAEDWLYCLELVVRGEIRLVEETLTGYRQHATAQSRGVDTRIGWHQTMQRWLESQASSIPAHAREAAENKHLKELANTAWRLKAQRNWKDYWKVRRYLQQQRRNVADVELVLQNRIYPRWAYGLADFFARIAGRDASRRST